MFKFYSLLKENWEELPRIIVMANAKEYVAAYGEMRRSIGMVGATCATPSLMKGEFTNREVQPILEGWKTPPRKAGSDQEGALSGRLDRYS